MAKHRSPAYPAINLEEAVGLIQKLYPAATKHPIGADVVAETWGYKSTTSASPYIAAVKHYGLIIETKNGSDRMLQLSDSGKDIAMDPEGHSSERIAAIKQAAVLPAAFSDMWEKWGEDLPPEGELRRYLERERDFNPKYVAKVASNYRESLEFAMLASEDTDTTKKDKGLPLGSRQNDSKMKVDPEAGPSDLQVGSFVQWTVDGQPRFPKPRKLQGISNCGNWGFVEGAKKAIPVSELQIDESISTDVPTIPSAAPSNPFLDQPEGPYISFPLSGGNRFELRLEKRISSKDFDRLKQLINLSEDSLVEDDGN